MTEEELRKEGVVPQYALADLAPEECRHGRAPWHTVQPLLPYRLGCSPLIFGGAVLGKGIHSKDEFLASTEPYRVVRLALQYGIRAIDTSPFYHPSEISLGRILEALRPEYPRESYHLQTKVGRYGGKPEDFDYSVGRVRQSIGTSLERLRTTYLDAALMHDVEFVSSRVGPAQEAGFAARDIVSHDDAIAQKARIACGLAASSASQSEKAQTDARVHGDGDQAVLDAVRTLFALKDEGKIRNVGIAGLPLPVLLRLSRLIACQAPYRPLDIILSYSHHTLNNDLLQEYRQLFAEEPAGRRVASQEDDNVPPWRAPRLINASPFSMGLLTDQGPPAWHPASASLKQAAKDAATLLKEKGKSESPSLAKTAGRFGVRGAEVKSSLPPMPNSLTEESLRCSVELPTIVGINSVEQVHDAVESYRVVLAGALQAGKDTVSCDTDVSRDQLQRLQSDSQAQSHDEQLAVNIFKERGLLHWMWASGD